MSCIVTIITANNETVEVEVPSLPDSLSELRQYIKGNKFNELKNKIRKAVGQGMIIKSQVLADIKKSGKVIPNTNLKTLKDRFGDKVNFPEGFDTIPILFTNSYKTETQELQFGIVEDGEDRIYVIDNNLDHLKLFANYLSLQRAIQEDNYLQKIKNKETKAILERCREASGFKSIEEMAIQYLNNKNIFRDFRTSKNESVFRELNDILSELGQMARRQEFKDPLANEFYLRLDFDGNNAFISLKELYEQILMQDEALKEVIPGKFEDFKKFIKSDSSTVEFDSFFNNEEGSKLHKIINYIVNKEPWLNFEYVSDYRDTLKLRKLFPSVGRVYGIGFDTIKTMQHKDYRGWYIFSKKVKGKTRYYPSKEFLTPNTRSEEFNTFKEASDFIDNSINKSNFKNTIELQELFTNGDGRRTIQVYFPEGSLIRIRDIKTKFGRIYSQQEKDILEKQTMEDFYKYLQKLDPSGKLSEQITNPLDAMLFIYEVNNQIGNENRSDVEKLIKIAQDINSLPYKYYYVETTYQDKRDTRFQRVIEAKGESIEEYKENPKAPVIGLFNAISKVFNDKFGITVEVLTNDEVKEKYQVENAKAFILGDKIILNSTLASSGDIFHEYSHLVLGYLKKSNYDSYIKLMESTWNMLPVYIKNLVLNNYGTLPRSAQYEEGFVIAFGKFVSDNYINKDLENLFKTQTKFIQSGLKSIFDGETDIKKIFGGNTQSVFNRFNQEIGYLINGNSDFLSFVKSDEFFMQRKKINWLEKQLEDGNIKEEC